MKSIRQIKTKSVMPTLLMAMTLLSCMILSGCSLSSTSKNSGEAADREELMQFSTIQALTKGDYYGEMTVEQLLTYGDIGLGTFDALNGEMIILDGICYQAISDGSIVKSKADDTVPFACTTYFDSDFAESIKDVTDIDSLKAILSQKISTESSNSFYAVKITGTFDSVHVRSEYAQKEPYRMLNEVMLTDQTEFEYDNITGTIVAVYFPDYMDGLNATGWHLHFISDDYTKGGHVLGVSIDNASAEFDRTESFNMVLPDSEVFAGLQLTDDLSEAIDSVEKGEN